MSRSNNKVRERRKRLWHRDPHCYWCGVLTVLPPDDSNSHRKNIPLTEATLDHLRSRWNPNRGKPTGHPHTVLSCWKCNNTRNNVEMQTVGIEKVRERSKSPPTDWAIIIYEQACEIKKLRAVIHKAILAVDSPDLSARLAARMELAMAVDPKMRLTSKGKWEHVDAKTRATTSGSGNGHQQNGPATGAHASPNAGHGTSEASAHARGFGHALLPEHGHRAAIALG